MWALFSPHCETRRFWVSGEVWVEVGKGSVVLVPSVYWAATALGGSLVVAAETK